MESHDYFSKYDDFVSDTIKQHHVPGVSIAVVQGDSTYTKAYGIARFPDEKVEESTLFNAASMTKSFVAAAVTTLVDDPDLEDMQWTTPVSRIMRDEFVLSDHHATETVTVEDILSHQSGLPDQDEACFGIHAKTPDTIESCTRKLRYLPLSVAPHTKFQYCNLMFVAATYMVEKVTGQWMGDFLRSKFWQPLEMHDTFFGNDDLEQRGSPARMTFGYGWDEEASDWFEIAWPVQPEAAGAGEIITTASDYARYLRCMLRQSPPISPAGHAALRKPRIIEDTAEKVKAFFSHGLYTLGWTSATYHGETFYGHGGSTSGFTSLMLFLPGQDWAAVIFANSSDGTDANSKILWTLVDDLLCVPQDQRLDWDAEAARDMEEDPDPVLKDIYPKIPDPPIPLTLPLASYAGKYHNRGYGAFDIRIEGDKLNVDLTDRTWRTAVSLSHVSGEYFAAEARDVDIRTKSLMRAQFVLDANGSVGSFGIGLVPDLDGEMIWFKRVPS